MSSTRRTALLRLVGTAVVTLLAVTLLPGPAEAKVTKTFFGMHDSSALDGPEPQLPAGVGSLRLWDAGVAWRQIETSKKVFDFTLLDSYVALAEEAGAKPLLALGQTPQFYASRPGESAFLGDGAASMPNVKAWKRYVKKVVNKYGTRLDYQIWNEPNVKGFWSGSRAEMAKLTMLASKIIHGAEPKATVVAPSFPVRLRSQKGWFDKFWKERVGGKRVGAWVDVAAVNPYPMPDQQPEQADKLVSWARKTLKSHGVRKPIWNTEINYGLLGGGTADPIPMKLQQSFVVRTFVLNAQAGVQRVFWYRWDLRQIANTLMTQDGEVTKAGEAFGVVRSWLLKTKPQGCETSKKGVWTCEFRYGKGVKRVYWKPKGSRVKVRAPKGTRTVTDQDGVTTSLKAGVKFTVNKYPRLVDASR